MEKQRRVVVGFSGGVDSATVVKILRENGFEPVAVFLKMLPDQKIDKIKILADKLGVELVVKDISNIFADWIIKGFVDEYKNNRTPNPCVKCNFEVKFRNLLKVADEMGIEKIATGHYARIEKKGDRFKLLKGKDQSKDQSYFLYRLTQKELSRIIFPLGDKLKEDVKKHALENDWFEKIKESQDICFLEEQKDAREFLKENLKAESNQPGNIKDESGRILGEHQGLAYYTQGQRKGLDLSGGPFYVIGKKEKENILVVSRDKNHLKLNNKDILLKEVNWTNGEPEEEKRYEFKSRYRSQLVTGLFEKKKNNWQVVLDEAQWAVAVGQSLVCYDGDEVVGGGIIESA